MKTAHADRLLKILLVIAFLLVVAHLALKYVSVIIHNEQHAFLFELSNRFDLNDEMSVPQWYTQALFLAGGLAAFLAAYMANDKGKRRLWAVIAVLGLVLSIDDVATLHEFTLQSLHLTFFDESPATFTRNAWFIVLPFVVLGLGWLLVRAVRVLPRRTTLLLATGGIIFIIGAVLVDSLDNTVTPRSFMSQGVIGAVEGGLQMIGSIIFLYGIADYLERYHSRALVAAVRQLKAPKD